MSTLFSTILSLLIIPCLCHVRLFYPPPRSTQTAPRSGGPCGGDSWDDGVITSWKAGSKVTITISEQIHHIQQPYRIALSQSNKDTGFEDCILLNHIPQHTRGGAKNLEIELTLPTYTCRNCTLQLINFQTSGLDDDSCCAYTNNDTKTCGAAQYWSCANVDITGGTSDDKSCYQPSDWAFRDYACNYYSSESSASAWEEVNSTTLWLLTGDSSIDGVSSDFCGDSDVSISEDSSCKATYSESDLSFVEGGELQTDGAIAIVIVLICGIAIGGTYFYSK
eukprot:445850_1